MTHRTSLMATACIACLAMIPSASAQVVQLPTRSVFGVQTTVSVPDGGRALLGGVDRSAIQSSSRGVPVFSRIPGAAPLFSSRSLSHSTSASRAYATATIIDHRELDRAVLSAARRTATARHGRYGRGIPSIDPQLRQRSAFLSANVARAGIRKQPVRQAPPNGPPVGLSRRFATAADARSARQQEAERFLEKGRDALARDRMGAAKVFFQMALRRTDGERANAAREALAYIQTRASHPGAF